MPLTVNEFPVRRVHSRLMMARQPTGKPDTGKIDKAAAQRYLAEVLGRQRTSIPRLAKAANISPNTLYRIEDDGDPYLTSLTTIRKLEAATGMPFADALGSPGARPRAREAERLGADEIPEGLVVKDHEAAWRLGTRAVDLCGFVPGDVIVFALDAGASAGDIVVAANGNDETVIRVYDAPYLVTRSLDPVISAAPMPVDGNRVRILGTFARMLRTKIAA